MTRDQAEKIAFNAEVYTVDKKSGFVYSRYIVSKTATFDDDVITLGLKKSKEGSMTNEFKRCNSGVFLTKADAWREILTHRLELQGAATKELGKCKDSVVEAEDKIKELEREEHYND